MEAKDLKQLYTDKSTGMSFEIKVDNFSMSWSATFIVTPIKAVGTADEKRFPSTQLNDNGGLSVHSSDLDGFGKAVESDPFIKARLEELFKKVLEKYK